MGCRGRAEAAQDAHLIAKLDPRRDLAVERLDNVEVVTGDLRDPSLAKTLIADMDVVIHMAARVGGIGGRFEQRAEGLVQARQHAERERV